MTIDELIKKQEEFDAVHSGNFNWNQKIGDNNVEIFEFLLIALMGEMGETSNLLKKVLRGDYSLDDVYTDIKEEIIDMFIYVIKMCYQLDIDIETEYCKKMNKNTERFKLYEK